MLNKIKLFLITILLMQSTSCVKSRAKSLVPLLPTNRVYIEFRDFKFSEPNISKNLIDFENFLRVGEYVESELVLKKLLLFNLSNNEKSKLFYHLANSEKSSKEKRIEKIEYYYKKSIDFAFWNSEKAYIYEELGYYYQDNKNFDKAENSYKKAIELDREKIYIRNLAHFYYQINKNKEGNEFIETTINSTFFVNDKIELLELLLENYTKKKDVISIERTAKQILSLDKENYVGNFSLASIYFQQKKYIEFEALMKQGLTFYDSDKKSYYFNLVRLYKEQNRLADLEKTYIDIKSSFKAIEYYYFLEEFYYTQKRYIDLEKLYKEKLSKNDLKDKEKLTIYTSLALLSILKKDLNTANTYFENALTSFGSDYSVLEKVSFMRNYLTFQKLMGVNENNFIETKDHLIEKHLTYSPKYSEVEKLKLEFDNLDFYKFNSLNQETYRYNDAHAVGTMSYTLSLSLEEAKKDNPKLEDIPPTNN